MLDARDHICTPVITSCPSYVQHDGVTYEVAPDALVMRVSDLRVERDKGRTWDQPFPTRPFDRYSFNVRAPASTRLTMPATP